MTAWSFLLYRWWQVPYYWLGIKMYDLVSGTQILKSSYFLNKSRSMEIFPHLQEKKLKGALVYYDGESTWHLFALLVMQPPPCGASPPAK